MTATDTAREDWIQRAKNVPIAEVAARHTKLRKQGRELIGPCPAPECGSDDDGFSVNPAKRVCNCRQCGLKGDVIALTMKIEGINFNAAVERLAGEPSPKNDKPNSKARGNGHDTKAGAKKEPVATFRYTDEHGKELFSVVRFHFRLPDGGFVLDARGKPVKEFGQKRPAPDGEPVQVWGLGAGEFMRRAAGGDWGAFNEERWAKLPASRERKKFPALDEAARRTPYRLPDLLASLKADRTIPILIVEGEGKVDALAKLGITATCCAEGALKWTKKHAEHFVDADVVILADNDEPGRKHRNAVVQSLKGIAARVRALELPDLPPKGDVIDWLKAGGTRERLEALINEAPEWGAAAGAVANIGGFNKVERDGTPAANWENAMVAIRELGITCRHDLFHGKYLVGGHVIGNHVGELSDPACSMLRHAILLKFGFDPGVNHTRFAAEQLCLTNPFDPVIDYLDGLKWDGKKRLEKVLITYFGAADTPFNRAIGPLVFVALVRRAKKPGTKFDEIIVLEGAEGTDKSTALLAIAGGNEFFSDQTIFGLSDKAQQENVKGIWVYEIAELTGIRRAELESVKAFASRTHDKARPAYGHFRVDQPRRCVFFATTNDDDYLQSDTGDRRFWPVQCGRIDVAALKRDRDQLFAEAVAMDLAGVSLRLPPHLWAAAKVEQDARHVYDPWVDRLEGLKGTPTADLTEMCITTAAVFAVLEIPAERQTVPIAKRLKGVMKRLGWRHAQLWDGEQKKNIKGYFRSRV